MRVERIISKSRDGNRMEVIGRDADGRRTLHLHRKNDVWRYSVGYDREDKQVFLPIKV